MITEIGTVTRVDAEGAWVTTVKTSVCTACRAQSGCGQKLLNGAMGSSMDIRARYDAGALGRLVVGDRVEIGIEEGAVVGASLIAYGLPLILMVSMSAWLGRSSLLMGLAAAALGLLLGGLGVRYWLGRQTDFNRYEPVVTRRLDSQAIVTELYQRV